MRDVAKAHVGAVLHADVSSVKRYIVSAGSFSFDEAARIGADLLPEHAHRFAKSDRLTALNPTDDGGPAERDFDFTCTCGCEFFQ